MAWLRIDEALYRNHKARDLPPAPFKLWIFVLSTAAERESRGVLSSRNLMDAAYNAGLDLPTNLVHIVEARLLHDDSTIRECERCFEAVGSLPIGTLGAGDYYVHDWEDYCPPSDNPGSRRWQDARRQHLGRNTSLKQAVTDKTHGRCGYCGLLVTATNPSDRRSRSRLTRDHIDPLCTEGPGGYGNVLSNLVLACGACNSAKGQQTPDEAGMRLLTIAEISRLDFEEGVFDHLFDEAGNYDGLWVHVPTGEIGIIPAGQVGLDYIMLDEANAWRRRA